MTRDQPVLRGHADRLVRMENVDLLVKWDEKV